MAALSGPIALGKRHDDSVALARGPSETLTNLVFAFEQDAPSGQLPRWGRKVGQQLWIWRQEYPGAALLVGVKLFAELPPRLSALVSKMELPVLGSGSRC